MGFGGNGPDEVSNDPRYGNQWGLECIDAEEAWDVVPDNLGIILAIIDTGVDVSHANLMAHYDTAIDRDFVSNDYDADDDMGHGTHVAGIAVVVTDNNEGIAGLAPVKIMGIKVMNWLGFGLESDIVTGIDYAADNGAHVINMSLGSTSCSQADSSVIEAILDLLKYRTVTIDALAGISVLSGDRDFDIDQGRDDVLIPLQADQISCSSSLAVS